MSQGVDSRTNFATILLIFMGIVWLLFGGVLIFFPHLIFPPTVTVQWDTETEINTAGFNLYRGESENDDYMLINDTLIDSEGNSVSGASYEYVDKSVERGKTFYYLLEEVQIDGQTNRYEEAKFSYEVPGLSGLIVLLAAVVIVVGLALLVMGFKELRN